METFLDRTTMMHSCGHIKKVLAREYEEGMGGAMPSQEWASAVEAYARSPGKPCRPLASLSDPVPPVVTRQICCPSLRALLDAMASVSGLMLHAC